MAKSKKPVKKKRNLKQTAYQLISYFISGGVWFWSGYVLIVLLDDPLGAVLGYSKGLFLANLIGNTVGFTLNFILLRYWVFKTNKPAKLGTATTRYIVYTVINVFGLNYLILLGLKNVGIDPAIGQFIASGFFTIWNYVWYKLYVFKEPEPVKKKAARTNRHASTT